MQKFNEQKEKMLEAAQEEADQYIIQTRNSVNQIVDDLKAKALEALTNKAAHKKAVFFIFLPF